MPAVANVRVNTQVPFPALVVGAGGISVAKVNGVWTIGPLSGTFATTGTASTWTALQTYNAGIDAAGIVNTSFITSPTFATLTGTSGSVGFSTPSLVINSSGSFTLTLPAPSALPGGWLYIKNVNAHAVVSASSNVVPLNSTSAGTAIITGTAAGDWVWMQSDGTHWQIMAGVIT